jgi:outer membrane protein assembly factor BamB
MLAIVLTALLVTTDAHGADSAHWPQFRGPNGSGVAPDDLPGPVRFGPEENVTLDLK